MNEFLTLGLSAEIVDAIQSQGYVHPTPIQEAAIPKALAGHDILAAAQTGTGKTAAFMLPSIERLKRYANTGASPAMHPVRMLVLAPTRELVEQIEQNVVHYLKHLPLRHMSIYGGMHNTEAQKETLRLGCEIVISTTGRLLDHLQNKNLQLNKVEILVLDEADMMLNMGFIDDVRKILQLLPVRRQILLFSATFPEAIKNLANDFMHLPQMIEVNRENSTSENVQQLAYAVDTFDKRKAITQIIDNTGNLQIIVFCKTKISVDQVTRHLQHESVAAQALHGDKSQAARLEILQAFKQGEVRILVATDVASRGLDISQLPLVINYELPAQAEDYVHRIGRTGRAGEKGCAISLVDENEKKMFDAIVELTQQSLHLQKMQNISAHWLNADESNAPVKVNTPQIKEGKTKLAKVRVPSTSRNVPRLIERKRPLRTRMRETCALLLPNYGIEVDAE